MNRVGMGALWCCALILVVGCSDSGLPTRSGDPDEVSPAARTEAVGSPRLSLAEFPAEAEGLSAEVRVKIRVRNGRVVEVTCPHTGGVHPAFVREAVRAANGAGFPPGYNGEIEVPYTFRSFASAGGYPAGARPPKLAQ